MKERIAIIGSGISGLGAAYLLNEQYNITIYEKNDYVGGDARTKYINYNDLQIPVDTGFIAYNPLGYPNLAALFTHLGVETIPSDNSFGVSAGDGWLEYGSGSAGRFFGQRLNLFRPLFHQMLRDAARFNKEAATAIKKDSRETLGEFISRLGLSEWFEKYYLVPLGCVIWNYPPETMLGFPATSFLKFFSTQQILSGDNQQWRSIMGGSVEYVRKLVEGFGHKIKLSCGAEKIRREKGKIIIEDSNKKSETFDHIIFACPPALALKALEKPTERERKILSAFKYQENYLVLHDDETFMPRRRSCWASRMYSPENGITYWINNLQSIDDKYPLFLSVNPTRAPKGKIFDEHIFHQPVFDREAIFAQTLIPQIQGEDNSWFIGAYQRFGTHEDGLAGAVYVAKKLGVEIPW